MPTLEDHIYTCIAKKIQEIDAAITSDVYAISFYYWSNEDDPRQAMLTVSYNTNHQTKATEGDASAPAESKWNYAFWLQDQGLIYNFGESNEDMSIRETWIKSEKLWWSDKEEDDDFDRTIELGEKITKKIISIYIKVAKRIHEDGVIVGKFKNPIPIIVHELEYYDAIAKNTKAANPKGLAKDFEKWVASL